MKLILNPYTQLVDTFLVTALRLYTTIYTKNLKKITRPNKKYYTYEEKQFLVKCLSSAVSENNNANNILFG